MSGAVNYDGIAITKLYLFGTADVSMDFNLKVRNQDPPTVSYGVNSQQFFEFGPGRFAWPSRANIVEDFFQLTNSATLTAETYSLSQLILAMQADGYVYADNDVVIPIYNYGTALNSADYAERAYIFGTSEVIMQDAQFTVNADGSRSISSIQLLGLNDNWDLESSEAQLINNLLGPFVEHFPKQALGCAFIAHQPILWPCVRIKIQLTKNSKLRSNNSL